jgi:hypothetical protein
MADGTLTTVAASGWPRIPEFERPRIGTAFVGLVPAVDDAGNDRAGIRLPEVAVPLATHTGWNHRRPSIGAPDDTPEIIQRAADHSDWATRKKLTSPGSPASAGAPTPLEPSLRRLAAERSCLS